MFRSTKFATTLCGKNRILCIKKLYQIYLIPVSLCYICEFFSLHGSRICMGWLKFLKKKKLKIKDEKNFVHSSFQCQYLLRSTNQPANDFYLIILKCVLLRKGIDSHNFVKLHLCGKCSNEDPEYNSKNFSKHILPVNNFRKCIVMMQSGGQFEALHPLAFSSCSFEHRLCKHCF